MRLMIGRRKVETLAVLAPELEGLVAGFVTRRVALEEPPCR